MIGFGKFYFDRALNSTQANLGTNRREGKILRHYNYIALENVGGEVILNLYGLK